MLEHHDYWHWFGLAVFLGIVEIIAPGFFFLWLAIAAVAMGAVCLIFPAVIWELQVLLFPVLAVLSVIIWHKYYHKKPTVTDQPFLNQREKN